MLTLQQWRQNEQVSRSIKTDQLGRKCEVLPVDLLMMPAGEMSGELLQGQTFVFLRLSLWRQSLYL